MLLSILKSSLRLNPRKNNVSVYCSKCQRCLQKLLKPKPFTHSYFENVRYISCNSALKNYYNTLGIERSASKQDIKEAYIKLSKIYHPDKILDGFNKQELNSFLKVGRGWYLLTID